MIKNNLLANHFYNLGLNITCITNYVTQNNFYDANILKGPYHEWTHLKDIRQTPDELQNLDWDNSVGMGTVAGFDKLHVLDIDGCSNYNFVEDILKIIGLPKQYEWVVKTGSLDGYHIYFYSDFLGNIEVDQVATSYQPNLDNTGLFEKMELLWGTHVVLPNSIHKSGSKYAFTNCKFPKEKPKYIDINKFKIIEYLFLNISDIENKKFYFSVSKEKHRNIQMPNNINFLDLSTIEDRLFFLFNIESEDLSEGQLFPSIVQISWVIMCSNGIVYKNCTEIIAPELTKKSETFKNNRIDKNVISQIVKEPSEVFQDISYDIKYCEAIVTHELNWNLPILQNAFEKYLIDFDFDTLEQVCTMEYCTSLFNYTNKPNLAELYKFLFHHEVKQFQNTTSFVNTLSKCVKELLYKGELKV